MASVQLRNVTKAWGDVVVSKDINLDIHEGEFVVFVGPSGCGKSTLLRMIAGLETITSGDLFIGDTRMNEIPPAERGVGMVFQSYALYPHLSVAENMSFGLKLAGAKKEVINQRVTQVAEVLQLAHLLERKPKALSGGQRQRVAIGRTLVAEPRVFLLDEPLSNLDAALRVQMRIEISRLHKRLGRTMIYVTHDQVEAMTLADKIVVMNYGKVEQMGSPMDLYYNPINKFVAGFIGSPEINQLRGEVVLTGNTTNLRLKDGSLLALPVGLQVTDGQQVVYAIRPEQVNVVHEARDDALAAKVTAVENTGSDMQLFCDTGGGAFTSVFKQRLAVKEGDTIWLQPKLSGVHLFDAQSGLRIACLEGQ